MSQPDTFETYFEDINTLLRIHYGVQLSLKAKPCLQALHKGGYSPADTISYIARNDGLAPLQAAR